MGDDLTIHQEHAEQRDEHAAWMSDIEQWRVDRRRAEQTLAAVQEVLADREAALEELELALASHEREILTHERMLGHGAVQEELVAEHEAFWALHDRITDAHKGFAERHTAIMAEVRWLADVAGVAM
jgi:hypothetical protein